MGAYGYIDKAVPGMIADSNRVERNISRSIQDTAGINFGATAWSYIGDEEKCYNYVLDTAKIVWDADFITDNVITVTVNGAATAGIPFNVGGHDDTMDDVLAAVTALTGVDAALDPNDVNNRTLFTRTIGTANTTTESVTGGASQATGTITPQSDQVFLGVARWIQKYGSGEKYYQYDTVAIVDTGIIWANLVGAASDLDTAYVLASGANQGEFTSTVTDNLVTGTNFKSNAYTNPTSSDVIAIIEVNGQAKPNAEIAWS